MSEPDASVIERERELAVLGEFLTSDAPALGLVLTGGPGIGKTSLWEAGVRLAREQGVRALAARPTESEARLSFAALFDLLENIDLGALKALPSPQRRALETVLLRADPADEAPEPLAIAAAFLGAMRSLAATGPLLLAIDDLQWLDAASAAVLAFAARRLQGQRCRFLLARRSGRAGEVERALGPSPVSRLEVGPLSLSAIYRLLAERLGLSLPRRTLSRVYEATHGNPLLALELGRTLAGREAQASGFELPVADLADNPFGPRVAGLPGPARRVLLAAALSAHVSLPQLAALAEPVAVEELVASGLLLASAVAFDELGSGGWAEHARTELASLGARRPTPSGELTAAEQRVAALAASGLSNKEIARRLFVAVHTVEVHLAHAYAKLGVHSRVQLAGCFPAPASPPGKDGPSGAASS